MARRAAEVGLVLLLTCAARPGFAYVRAVAESGSPLAWKTTCIDMDLDLTSPPPTMTADEYFQAAVLAGQAWSNDSLACSGVALTISRNVGPAPDTGLDGRNVIVFRQDAWCEHPLPDDPNQRYCYPPNAFAVTTVFKNKITGEIADADMELNAVSYAWADLVAHPELADGATADFQNTVTHELGHVLGLAHPCWSANDGSQRLLDNHGLPELSCSDPNLPAAIVESTMFPSVSTSDTLRRTLAADDQQAVCDIYPASTASCPSTGSAGCSLAPVPPSQTGPSPPHALSLILVAVCLLLGLRYRSSLRVRARSRDE